MPASTPDLGLAAAMIALGYDFVGLADGEGRKLFLIAADDGTVLALNRSYVAGELTVPALGHARAIRVLKRELRSVSISAAS